MAARTAAALRHWSGGGELPIVIDASSCALGLRDDLPAALPDDARERHASLTIFDAVEWAAGELLDALSPAPVGTLALHPSCATRHTHTDRALRALASALAVEVTVPAAATCCGMAGDRGMLHPELTAAATAPQVAELGGRLFDAHVSSNRTCEIALEGATGAVYESVIQLLERQTRSASPA